MKRFIYLMAICNVYHTSWMAMVVRCKMLTNQDVESKKTHRFILVNTVFNYLNILMLLFDRIWSEQINRYDTNSKANAYTAYTV